MSKLAVLKETSAVATYMKAKFPIVLNTVLGNQCPNVDVRHPHKWSVEFALEVDQALDVLARAFHNQVSTNWDVRRYADHIGLKHSGTNNDFEDMMQKSFKPLKISYHLEITPCTITDCHGRLLVWYLPNILRPERQVSMFADLKLLERALKMDTKPSSNWRSTPESYHSVEGGLKAGSMSISPAWFEQGHESQGHPLKVSAELAKENQTCDWLRKSRLPFALIGGILSITQPELFEMGMDALRELESNPGFSDTPERLREVLGIWYTPFSALSVISNRVTPLHCDFGGRAEWMDLMLALGGYDNGRFSIPAFGYTFKYNPGTILGFSSKIFRHGATCKGDRAAIAFYMRDNVLNRLGLASGTWSQQAHYHSLLQPLTITT